MVEKKSKKGVLQRLWSVIKGFVNFLTRPYIWSGLLIGFIWSFPAPFILYTFASTLSNFPQEVRWALFFPITSSLQLMYRLGLARPDGDFDIFLLWGLSIIIGMIIGVAITYSIHRIRLLMRSKK